MSTANLFGSDKTGNSTYHSLQMKLQGEILPGFALLSAYTFSKNLTDGSDSRDLDNYAPNAGGGVQNGYNLRAEKTYARNDYPLNFVTSFLYDFPFGPGKAHMTCGIGSRVLGNWSLGGVLTYRSGTMISSPRPATSNVPLFGGSVRADAVSGVDKLTPAARGSFDPGRDVYLNAAAWASPAPYQFGNAARMSGVRTKPLLNEDFSLLKSTAITERLRLQFRAEAFNIFNRTVFGYPQTNLGSSDFGQIFTQDNKPRVLQLGLKLIY